MRRFRFACCAWIVAVAIGACDTRQPSAAGTPAAPTMSGDSSPLATGCEVRPSAARGPVNDPNGPFFHQMAIARTDDGVVLRDHRQVMEHASVPDGTRLPDGAIGVYYVNGAESAVWFARLAGDTITPVSVISINGVEGPAGVVDPDAILLPDGRVRLFYLNGFGSPTSAEPRAMCAAESTDGVRFQLVGPAIRFQGSSTETDPSVVQLRDGSWLMAISRGQQTVMARSADGLSFSAYATLTYGGVPEVALAGDGRVRLYVCARGIESYVSADDGTTWQYEAIVVPSNTLGRRIICDPSMVAGTNVFIFKTAN